MATTHTQDKIIICRCPTQYSWKYLSTVTLYPLENCKASHFPSSSESLNWADTSIIRCWGWFHQHQMTLRTLLGFQSMKQKLLLLVWYCASVSPSLLGFDSTRSGLFWVSAAPSDCDSTHPGFISWCCAESVLHPRTVTPHILALVSWCCAESVLHPRTVIQHILALVSWCCAE